MISMHDVRLSNIARITPWSSRVATLRAQPWVVGAAWVFVVVSLVQVAAATFVAGASTALGNTAVFEPAGLTYVGAFGTLLGLVEFLVVGAAAVGSTRKADRWRRIGHSVLVAWAALWLIGLYGLASAAGGIQEIARAAMMTLFAGCTAYRAVAGWRSSSAEPSSRVRTPRATGADAEYARAVADWRSVFQRDAGHRRQEQLTAAQVKLNSDRLRDVTPLSGTRERVQRAKDPAGNVCSWCQHAATGALQRVKPAARWSGGFIARAGRGSISKLRQWAVLPTRSGSERSAAA